MAKRNGRVSARGAVGLRINSSWWTPSAISRSNLSSATGMYRTIVYVGWCLWTILISLGFFLNSPRSGKKGFDFLISEWFSNMSDAIQSYMASGIWLRIV